MHDHKYLIKNRQGAVLETVPATFGIDSFELARARLAAHRIGAREPSEIYMVPESAARHVVGPGAREEIDRLLRRVIGEFASIRSTDTGRTSSIDTIVDANAERWRIGFENLLSDRWRGLGTSPSGKAMWDCTECGRFSCTPDKDCPDGCGKTQADRIAALEERLARSEHERETAQRASRKAIDAIVELLDGEIGRWQELAIHTANGGSNAIKALDAMKVAIAATFAKELTRIRSMVAPVEDVF